MFRTAQMRPNSGFRRLRVATIYALVFHLTAWPGRLVCADFPFSCRAPAWLALALPMTAMATEPPHLILPLDGDPPSMAPAHGCATGEHLPNAAACAGRTNNPLPTPPMTKTTGKAGPGGKTGASLAGGDKVGPSRPGGPPPGVRAVVADVDADGKPDDAQGSRARPGQVSGVRQRPAHSRGRLDLRGRRQCRRRHRESGRRPAAGRGDDARPGRNAHRPLGAGPGPGRRGAIRRLILERSGFHGRQSTAGRGGVDKSPIPPWGARGR